MGSTRLPTFETFVARFWARVDKNGPTIRPELGPCWLWTGGKNWQGYGFVSRNYRQIRATHVSIELTRGEVIPDDKEACHACDNPPCVNPEHVFAGTKAENQADKGAKGRAARGEKNGANKLTSADVFAIRATGGRPKLRDVGAAFGVSGTLVRKILRGEIWSHVQ